MTLTVLFSASAENWETYSTPLMQAMKSAGLDANLVTEADPARVNYVVYAPTASLQDFTPYKNTKAVLSLWAGVETIVTNKTLTMPLVRMVDPGMTQSMTAWVTGHVLRYHLGMDRHIVNPDHRWDPISPPHITTRQVSILGLGALGQASANALSSLGFAVSGWSRSAKTLNNVTTFSGESGLRDALRSAEILVLLMPDTADTENTLDAETLALLPKGARIINPGRGPLIDDNALLAALDSGHIAAATLDVFRTEPLPAEHPYWSHPSVTVTPHIAAETNPATASAVIAQQIKRGEEGLPFENVVDRTRGY